MDWIVVATAPHQLTAELWRDILRQEQIPSVLEASDAVSFLGVTPFPVRLRVPAEHASQALRLLQELADGALLLDILPD